MTASVPGYIAVVAMVETVWVLERAYRVPASHIAAAVEGLLGADVLRIECEQAVFTAMIALQEGRGSFADALIAALGMRAGCSHTLSFDRTAARLHVVKML